MIPRQRLRLSRPALKRAPNPVQLSHVSRIKGGSDGSTEEIQQFTQEVEFQFQKEIERPQVLKEGRRGSAD
jgi:hypothetical protein